MNHRRRHHHHHHRARPGTPDSDGATLRTDAPSADTSAAEHALWLERFDELYGSESGSDGCPSPDATRDRKRPRSDPLQHHEQRPPPAARSGSPAHADDDDGSASGGGGDDNRDNDPGSPPPMSPLANPFDDLPTHADEVWQSISMRDYEALHSDAAHQDTRPEDAYCAVCHNATGRYPPIARREVERLEDAVASGMRSGRLEEAINYVHRLFNDTIRRPLNEKLAARRRAAQQAAERARRTGLCAPGESAWDAPGGADAAAGEVAEDLPEWTRASIREHMLEHTNDPLMRVLRHAEAVSRIGMGIYRHNIVRVAASQRDDNGRPVVSFDVNAGVKAASILDKASNMILKVFQLLADDQQQQHQSSTAHGPGARRSVARAAVGRHVVPTTLPPGAR